MNIIKLFIKIIFYICGSFCLLWGVFCYLGGPDGRIGSLDSIIYGSVFLAAGLGFVTVARFLKTTRQLDTSANSN